jgi:hypothetical protein
MLMRSEPWPKASDIVFERDERWVEKDRTMAFTAEVKGRRVSCHIAEEVLKAHFSSEQFGRFQAFRENRRQIEEIAARTLESGLSELHLDLGHFSEADDYIPWEVAGSRI